MGENTSREATRERPAASAAADPPAGGSVPEADGPLVPPEWIPTLEQPAKGRPANRLLVAGVLLAGFALSCGAWVLLRGLYVDSTLEISRAAIEAAVSDDIKALEPLVPAETAASPAFRAASAAAKPRTEYTFTDHTLSGGLSANIVGPDGARGSYRLWNTTWGFGEVAVEWTGPPFGAVTGLVLLTLEDDGWRVWSITVGKKGISFAPEDAAETFGRPEK
jgi:hypothetical protein